MLQPERMQRFIQQFLQRGDSEKKGRSSDLPNPEVTNNAKMAWVIYAGIGLRAVWRQKRETGTSPK